MKKRVILENCIQCNRCGDIIRSYNKDDNRVCKCGLVAVGGGHTQLKRYPDNVSNAYTDLSVCPPVSETEHRYYDHVLAVWYNGEIYKFSDWHQEVFNEVFHQLRS